MLPFLIIMFIILLFKSYIYFKQKRFPEKDYSKLKIVIVVIGLVALSGNMVTQIFSSFYQPQFNEWKVYKSIEDKFSIKMPSKPSIYTEKEGYSHFDVVDNYSYQVMYFPKLYKLSPKEYLNRERDNIVRNVNGKLVGEKDISLGNTLGKELVVTGEPEIIINMRIFITADKVYEIWNEVPQNPSKLRALLNSYFPPMTKEYLDSFNLKINSVL